MQAFSVILAFSLIFTTVYCKPTDDGDDPTDAMYAIQHSKSDMGDIAVPKSGYRNVAVNWAWKDGIVPYVLQGYTKDEEAKIEHAFDYLMYKVNGAKAGCLNIKRRTTEQNYLLVHKSGRGCWSYVGHVINGAQKFSLDSGCIGDKNTPIHEMIHALGFSHEQDRPDRDQYVKVLYENMDQENHGAFRIAHGSSTLDTPYSYMSLMHYNRFGFSNNGKPTLVPIREPTTINGGVLTELDVERIRKLYKCLPYKRSDAECYYMRTENRQQFGPDMRSIVTRSEAECRDECRYTANCLALTYVKKNRNCFLHSARGVTVYSPGMNHFVRQCGRFQKCRMEMRSQTQKRGYGLKNVRSEKPSDCSLSCLRDEECVGATYNVANKRCYLHHSGGKTNTNRSTIYFQKICG